MKKTVFAIFILTTSLYAQTAALSGYCNLGAAQATVSGLSSTNYQQGLIPSCTVTVYLTGTTTLATIYSDSGSTVLSNPFTANTNASWMFYATTGAGYDVVLSGGTSPNVYPSPVTITGIFPQGAGASYCTLSGCTMTGAIIAPNLAPTVAALVAMTTPTTGVRAIVADYGYGQGGGGIFEYTTNTITPDGCINFAPASGGGTWIRQVEYGTLYSADCGTKANDSSFDNEPALERLSSIAAAHQYIAQIGPGLFYLKNWNICPVGSIVGCTVPPIIEGSGYGYTELVPMTASSGVFINYTNVLHSQLLNLHISQITNTGDFPNITSMLDTSISSSYLTAPSQHNRYINLRLYGHGLLWRNTNNNDSAFEDISLTGADSNNSKLASTAYSGDGTTLVITVPNTLQAGDRVIIYAGSTDALYALNDTFATVLSTGLSTSQIEIASTISGSGSTSATISASTVTMIGDNGGGDLELTRLFSTSGVVDVCAQSVTFSQSRFVRGVQLSCTGGLNQINFVGGQIGSGNISDSLHVLSGSKTFGASFTGMYIDTTYSGGSIIGGKGSINSAVFTGTTFHGPSSGTATLLDTDLIPVFSPAYILIHSGRTYHTSFATSNQFDVCAFGVMNADSPLASGIDVSATTCNVAYFGSYQAGNPSASGTPHINFFSSGNTGITYDAQIQASGGSSTNGQGQLNFTAKSNQFTGGIVGRYLLPLQATITAATTIAPTSSYMNVTGSAEIDTITLPSNCSGFSASACYLVLVPYASPTWTIGTSGNIAQAYVPSENVPVQLFYNPNVSKWFPVVAPRHFAVSLSPAAVSASTCAEQAFSLSGPIVGQVISGMTPPSAMSHVSVGYSRMASASSLVIQFCGDSTGGTPPNGTWSFIAD